jgi:hypothetical protein
MYIVQQIEVGFSELVENEIGDRRGGRGVAFFKL